MKTLKFALKNTIPLVFSYIFVGIAVGILFNEAGYSPLWTFFTGIFVYAGSMQIVMVSLLKSGTNLFIVAIMTFFINARHMFYGITFIEEFRNIAREKHSFWKAVYMSLTMTDETYSVLCYMECPKGVNKEKAQFYVLFFCHMLWIISSTLGGLIGELLPFDTAGIEFSATAFFITVVVNQWIKLGSHIPVITGLICSVVFYLVFGPDNFILPALSVSMIVILFMKEKVISKMEMEPKKDIDIALNSDINSDITNKEEL